MVKVTVGIPVYNSGKTIEKTLLSLLKVKNINIIVSDNYSDDSTHKICTGFSKKFNNIKYVRHSKNHGAKFNFEYVLSIAKTKYFMWLGSDDYLVNVDLNKASQLLVDRNNVAVSLNSYFSYPGRLLPDKSNISLRGPVFLRLMLLFIFPGANSRIYSIFRRKELLCFKSEFDYWGSDMALSAQIAMNGNWILYKKGKLIRKPGPSSSPLICRRNGGLKGIFIYIPKPLFFLEIFNRIGLIYSVCIFPIMAAYYLRLLISPIKHYLSNNKK
jgi:glycosyltransferase involved in cell wall biosynthesis